MRFYIKITDILVIILICGVILTKISALAIKEEADLKEAANYTGFKVLTVEIKNHKQFNIIKNLQLLKGNEVSNLDFWTNPKLNGTADIMIGPNSLKRCTKIFKDGEITFRTKIHDVAKLIAKEQRLLSEESVELKAGSMVWNSYRRWSEIELWIKSLPEKYSIASVQEIGQTFEKRTIYMVKVSTGKSRKVPGAARVPKKAIFIDANIHAREWISSATATWLLNELLSNSRSYQDILAEIDFYFVPMINIDGYEHTHEKDRFWRKTRSTNPRSNCRGVDPNRNFGFKFGGEGTSDDPCSDIFRGNEAFSESETKAIRDVLKEIQATQTIWAYISLHCYSQLWLLPWGYATKTYPEDFDEILEWGKASVAAIKKVHGKVYETGTGADILYAVGGASDDYAKDIGIKYVATAELRDTGNNGFVLPASQIVATAQEILPALLQTARTVMNHK